MSQDKSLRAIDVRWAGFTSLSIRVVAHFGVLNAY